MIEPVAARGAGRLTGTVIGVSSMPSPPLSVEGHAHRLIDEAVCKERLGKMYIWCAAGSLRRWDRNLCCTLGRCILLAHW